MTDYWIPSKKHYCEVCRCWVTGHSQNITRHESSIRHITSLRNKMLESHKKRTRRKKLEKFEEEEMKRLNTITLDNPIPTDPTTSLPYVNDMFSYGPIVQPTLDVESEKKMIANTINRTLSGYGQPEHVNLTYNTSNWIASIDQEDGTLVYFNRFTGVRTKTRPKDFDGVIPSSSAYLTSNWVMKYDPMKARRYYHNVDTGEVRWLDENTETEVVQPQSYYTQSELLQSSSEFDTTPMIQYNVKPENKVSHQHIQVSFTQNIKPDPVDVNSRLLSPQTHALKNNGHNNISGPVIGQWEVVNPTESVFSHWVENTEIILSPELTQHLHDNVGNNLINQEDTLLNNRGREKRIPKPKYKVKSEEMFDYSQNDDDKPTPLFNKRKVRRKKQ